MAKNKSLVFVIVMLVLVLGIFLLSDGLQFDFTIPGVNDQTQPPGGDEQDDFEGYTPPNLDDDVPDEQKYYCCQAMGVESCYLGGCPSSGIELSSHNTIALCNAACSQDEEEPSSTYCGDVVLPDYGDLDALCQEEGSCSDYNQAGDCHHYWDYNAREHKCGCTPAYYCGQYCYEYYYTNDCECPPGSYREMVTRSTFVCIPDGYDYCEDGVPQQEATVEACSSDTDCYSMLGEGWLCESGVCIAVTSDTCNSLATGRDYDTGTWLTIPPDMTCDMYCDDYCDGHCWDYEFGNEWSDCCAVECAEQW